MVDAAVEPGAERVVGADELQARARRTAEARGLGRREALDHLGRGSRRLLAVGEREKQLDVRAQLRRGRPGENGSVVRAGLLSLDVARRQAKLGDVVAALSDREFRLLHHLVLHEGEVVSRERLLADVWGYHFDPRSNVVDVCIRRLRQKLGTDAPIETVRHGGYRLNAA